MVEVDDLSAAQKLEKRKQNLDFVDSLLDKLLDAFKNTEEILHSGIKSQAIPVSLLSLSMYADLLHGGAYRNPVETLPYYRPEIQAAFTSDRFTKDVFNNLTLWRLAAPYNVPLDGATIAIPAGAKPEQIEVIMNANELHIFPKLLSDQTYYLIKEWVSLYLTGGIFKDAATAVSTLIEAATSKSVSDAGLLGTLMTRTREVKKK